jgi:YcfA-like protein.
MTAEQLKKLLKKAGWRIEPGAKHDLAINDNRQRIAIPRHKGDIPIGTVQSILKEAGLK